MYKNFNLTESERKEIMEMHMSHGYRKPLKEEIINLETYNGENDIITEISLVGISQDGNPITKIILNSGLNRSENKNIVESSNVAVISEWMLEGKRIPYSRSGRSGADGTYFVIKNVIDINLE